MKAINGQIGIYNDYKEPVYESVNLYSLKLVKESSVKYETDKLINSPAAAAEYFKKIFDIGNRPNEIFAILALTAKNKLAGAHMISQGTVNNANVHPREVYKCAILNNATAIVLGHNHPSGDLSPSREDIETTKRLILAGKIIGIDVLDHIIMGDSNNYMSLREQGLIYIDVA